MKDLRFININQIDIINPAEHRKAGEACAETTFQILFTTELSAKLETLICDRYGKTWLVETEQARAIVMDEWEQGLYRQYLADQIPPNHQVGVYEQQRVF